MFKDHTPYSDLFQIVFILHFSVQCLHHERMNECMNQLFNACGAVRCILAQFNHCGEKCSDLVQASLEVEHVTSLNRSPHIGKNSTISYIIIHLITLRHVQSQDPVIRHQPSASVRSDVPGTGEVFGR